ncbi:hypothetical protein GSS88_06470 [Corynebacterium sp. 3HC-13]|uniref:hypothetical protein n=1 Tax=Corynebacterium poyangense TaxID=2684405 RepID=UPI001CCCF532|nr:hypothetical protein [Corynebacterium poyangense]MBZ8177442.1 hypothetical protein [Corynebacterium poyangense]
MSSSSGRAAILPFPRQCRVQGCPPKVLPPERTVVLQVCLRGEGVYRILGVKSSLSLAELGEVLAIALGVDEVSAPHTLRDPVSPQPLCPQHPVSQQLFYPGDRLLYQWGLWCFELNVVDSHPRDTATPERLCIGGAGEFIGRNFNLAHINSRLSGESHSAKVLATAHPDLQDWVIRAGSANFIPLLQALDLSRPTTLSTRTQRALELLPLETSALSRDSWWATLISLSCLCGRREQVRITEELMDSLGWSSGGAPLCAEDIAHQCRDSLAVLYQLGAYCPAGEARLSPVERLEIYRFLLAG